MRTPRSTTRLAATVLAGAWLLGACGVGTDGPDPSTEPTTIGGSRPSSTALTATPSNARCAVPSVELLRTQDTAFEGTVTGVRDGTATLDVDTWYAGDETDQVTVSTPNQQLTDLLLAVDFQEGRTYLVSATEGDVSLCGLSAEKDELLTGLYERAYAG